MRAALFAALLAATAAIISAVPALAEEKPVIEAGIPDYSPGTQNVVADWRPPVACGRFNRATKVCEGRSGR